MKKYALINNSIVTSIVDLEDEEYSLYSNQNQAVVDITDITPQPNLNWVLNGNKLEFPTGNSDRELLEEKLAELKINTGVFLAKKAVIKIGARNKILNKNSSQISTILTSLLPVKLLLENGALGTARDACNQLKYLYTEYSDIFQYIINEINLFEQSNSL